MVGYLVGLTGLAATAMVARRLTANWAAPAVLLPIGWFAYACAALLVLPEPGAVVPGLMWVVLSCGAFLAGSVLAGVIPVGATFPSSVCAPSERYPWLAQVVLLLSAASIAALVMATRSLGFSPWDLLSLSRLARIAATSRAIFYFGDLEQSVLARVLMVLSYTGTLFAGAAFYVAKTTARKLVALVPLCAVLLLGAVHGSRMGILFGGTFWVSAYMAAALVSTGDRPRIGARILLYAGGLAVLLLAVLSTAVQFLRYFVGSQKTAALIIADPFGFLAAFAAWFRTDGFRASGFAGGFYMFERLGRMLGGTFPAFPVIDLGFTSSNVYTVFRTLIEDFGSAGALLVTAAIGCVGGYAFRAVLAGQVRWVAALALTYAFILTSPALSPFAYTGPTVGAVMFAAYATFALRDPVRVDGATA